MTELPPLPQPMLKVYERPHGLVELRYFTAEDMRAYAEAAIKQEREAAAIGSNQWADLWYFVMDEAPMAFERIVTTFSPKEWHTEAHKLMRAKYPSLLSVPVARIGG